MNLMTPIRHDPALRSFDKWCEVELRRRAKRLRALYSIQDNDVRQTALSADYNACKEDVQYWIEQYGWLTNPKSKEEVTREIPLVLFDKQLELLLKTQNCLADAHPLLINKGRELGVSWLLVFFVFHGWRFTNRFSAKFGSRKESLVDDSTLDSLFGKFRYILSKQPPHLREKNIKDILLQIVNNRNNSEIIGEATNPGFGRGGRKTIVVLDEFAHVLPNIANATWKSLDTVSDCIVANSTPNGKANKFYELYSTLPAEYVFSMTWQDNPYRDEKWKEERKKKLNDDEFDQEHGGSFAAIRVGRVFSIQKDLIEYDEFSEEWINIKQEARRLWMHIGAWDFGSGPSLTTALYALIEIKPNEVYPDIWIDDEDTWSRAEYSICATEALRKMENYQSHFKLHVGDPASDNTESDQSSWAKNLAMCGMPFQKLDQGIFNTQKGIEENIKHCQWMLDSGKIHVHTRCAVFWESIEQWRYNVPDGIPIEFVDKAWISPKKDGYSHSMNAFMYLVGFVCRYLHRSTEGQDLSALTKPIKSSAQGNLSEMLARARNV